MRALLPLMAILGVLTGTPASGQPQPAYFVDESKLPFAEVPGLPSQRAWGVLDGAGYRIEIPQTWNGSLVMWAHGYRGTGLELTVDDHPLRAYLLANGYAWAASSYSRNSYEPAQGAKDTHALAQYFKDTYGTPTRTYVTGASMGGHVTALVAEQWPKSYDGAASVCGSLGDYELFDFYLDFNVAAQTLSGVARQYPYGADYLTTTVPATKAALGPAFPFALNAQGQALAALTQLRSGGVRPLFDQGWLFWNGVAGDFLFGLGVDPSLSGQAGVAENTGVLYQFDTDPQVSQSESLFNAAVQRVAADPRARRQNGLTAIAPTTGDLKIPMITLHTLGDLYTPFHMEQEYARRVAAHGASDLLVQRATRDFGHCSFTPSELVNTFAALVGWVQGGNKPAGDDVLDPAAVASPTFGCTFTDKTAPRSWNTPGLAFLTPPACPQ
jgi:pimeloyl-ACP methyl ester carboxylesterase